MGGKGRCQGGKEEKEKKRRGEKSRFHPCDSIEDDPGDENPMHVRLLLPVFDMSPGHKYLKRKNVSSGGRQGKSVVNISNNECYVKSFLCLFSN